MESIDLSRPRGLKRLGIHLVTLSPGERSSLPHAESHEEEFVYVIQGHPHAWIDGWIYQLKPGHACGFKAGTGIGHSFINNSEQPVKLLVIGEQSKPENRCVYLVDPEDHQQSTIRWDDYPKRELGPHSGRPGLDEIARLGIKTGLPSCIVHAPSMPLGKSFHYPGDNETFGLGPRLTNFLGLEKLGISLDIIAPGHRSSFPHAHTIEEEFVFVLEGNADVWLNGHVHSKLPGQFEIFNPKEMVAHTVINNSESPLVLLVAGETAEFPGEKIAYPQNPLRNKEMDRINWFWSDFQMKNPGPHSGKPNLPRPDHLGFHLATEEHVNQVLQVFERTPEYFEKVDGTLPDRKIALHAIVDGPQKRSTEYFKEFLLVQHEGHLIGALDLHAHHPEKGIAYLGLLLLDKRFQGLGLGRKVYQLAEDYMARVFQARTIRLGISQDNDCSAFWKKMGFAPNGRTYSWQGDQKTSATVEWEKSVP